MLSCTRQQLFWFEFSDFSSWHTLAGLLRLQMRKFLCRKITVRFKLNLKTDGLNCRMIFKFGKRIERLHSASKQCLRIYKDHFCIAKHLLGNPKPLNCTVPMQVAQFHCYCCTVMALPMARSICWSVRQYTFTWQKAAPKRRRDRPWTTCGWNCRGGLTEKGSDFIRMEEIRGTYQDSVLWWSIPRDKPPTSPWMAFMW